MRLADLRWLAVAFASAAALAAWLGAQMAWVGLALAVVAAWRLVRAGTAVVGLVLSGVSGGFGAALYAASGAPWWIAVPLCLAASLAAGLIARLSHRTTTQMRDLALLAVAWIGPVVAAAPGVMEGWGAALALNQSRESAAGSISVWAWIVLAAALLAGGMRGYWKRR